MVGQAIYFFAIMDVLKRTEEFNKLLSKKKDTDEENTVHSIDSEN